MHPCVLPQAPPRIFLRSGLQAAFQVPPLNQSSAFTSTTWPPLFATALPTSAGLVHMQ